MSENTISYENIGIFSAVAIKVGSLSNGKGKKIATKEVAAHEFVVGNDTVKVPLHWFYAKMVKNAQEGERPVYLKIHFYSKYLKTIFETAEPERKITVRIKVSRKMRDKKVSDIILDVYPEKHNSEAKFDLVIAKTERRAIAVPNSLEKICFLPRAK